MFINPYSIKVSEQLDLPKEEEKVLEYWNKIDAFKLQLDKTKHLKPYTFYDGPPFATGLPHYGHICAGTIKVDIYSFCLLIAGCRD